MDRFEKSIDTKVNLQEVIRHLERVSEMEGGFIDKEIERLKLFMLDELFTSENIEYLLDTYNEIEEYKSRHNINNLTILEFDELLQSIYSAKLQRLLIIDKILKFYVANKKLSNIEYKQLTSNLKISKHAPTKIIDKEFKFYTQLYK